MDTEILLGLSVCISVKLPKLPKYACEMWELTPDDAEAYFQFLERTKAEVAEMNKSYPARLTGYSSVAEVKEALCKRQNSAFNFGIWLKRNQEMQLVGKRHFVYSPRFAKTYQVEGQSLTLSKPWQFGGWIEPAWQRKGILSASRDALAKHFTTNYPFCSHAISLTKSDHMAVVRGFEKSGMHFLEEFEEEGISWSVYLLL